MVTTPKTDMEIENNKTFHMELLIEPMQVCIDDEFVTSFKNSFNGESGLYPDRFINVSHPTFENPTERNPMNITDFFSRLDVSSIEDILKAKYGSLNYHYSYPLEAMIKSSMIRRIKCMRSFQKLVNRFLTNESDAKNIGFGNKIPNRRTFRHWENVRISIEDLQDGMDNMVKALRLELEKYGIKLDRRIGIDATPLEALFNDEDSKYNGHYKISGYKVHGVYDLDYEIPLAIVVTTAEKGDSPIFKDLLKKIYDLGIEFEDVYADGAYNGFENFALVHFTYGAKLYTNIDKDAVYREDGTEEGIQYQYNRLRNKPDFQLPDNLTLKDKMEFLMKYGIYEPIGAYYRNIHMKEWEIWKENNKENGDKIPYHLRNLTEGFHGFVKKYFNLQLYFDYRGIRKVERHIRWAYLAILGVALTRVQNGITDNLIQIAYVE